MEAAIKKINEELTDDNIQSFAYFPNNANLRFPVGEYSTIIAGARAHEKLHAKISCTGLEAKIASPVVADMVIQNYTYWEPFPTVMTGKDKTLHLKINPDKQFADRKFQLIVLIHCAYLPDAPDNVEAFNHGIRYTNVAYNGTVEMIDTSNALDFDFFLLMVIFGAFITFVLSVFTDLFGGSKSGKEASKPKPRARKVETGTVDSNGDEWLQGTYASTPKSSGAKTRSSRRKKK